MILNDVFSFAWCIVSIKLEAPFLDRDITSDQLVLYLNGKVNTKL